MTAYDEHVAFENNQEIVAVLDIESIPVVTMDRHIPRKEQARLTRQLFKKLGLKGISVTTPNYSMAHVVDIKLPKPQIHDETRWPHDHSQCCGPHNHSHHTEETRCPACRNKWNVQEKIEAILAVAFPKHDDRSDSQSDHFDFCWSVS